MESENLTYLNKGVSQDERLPDALLPDKIKIDDRDSISMVSFLRAYSDLLNYYSYDPVTDALIKDGNWNFFINNAVFRLAEIAKAPFTKVQQDIYLSVNVLQQPGSSVDEKIYALRLLFASVISVVTIINTWLAYIDVLPKKFVLRLSQTVKSELSHLLFITRAYARFYETHVNKSGYVYFNPALLNSFDRAHWSDLDNEDFDLEKIKKGVDLSPGISNYDAILTHTSPYIEKAAQDILHTYGQLISQARDSFNEIINDQSGTLKPDVALLITFLKLFETARGKINGLTAKHLDFYYKQVLKLSEAPLVPDTTFLVMQLADNCMGMQIEQGTAFDAGKDSLGNTITFSTLKNTVLNQTQVVDLRTLFVASNQIPNTTALITGIYNARNPIPAPPSSGFAALGEDQFMFSDREKTMQDSSVGFAVSSPAFFLNGGTRILHVSFNFTDDSFVTHFVDQLTAVAKNSTNTTDKTISSLFNTIFLNAFSISATGPKGWFVIKNSSVSYNITPGSSIVFTLTLAPAEDAIVAYNPQLHGASYNTPYPVLAFTLVNNFPYYAYNFLNELQLKNVSVKTEVQDLKNVSLYNQYGPVDAGKPFQPLGIQPEKGAYFLIGNSELSVKNITEIDVSIEWQALPVTGDFGTYYASYDPPFTNKSFRVAASFLNGNKWIVPSGYSTGFDLFNAYPGGNSTVVAPVLSTVSSFQLTKLNGVLKSAVIDPSGFTVPLKYDQNTPGSFLRLELINPPAGFGASMYSNVLSTVVMSNAKLQMEQMTQAPALTGSDPGSTPPADPAPLPYPPFTPLAKTIAVNYTSEDVIDIVQEPKDGTGFDYFYHIDAFSIYPALADNGSPETHATKQAKPAEAYKLLLPYYVNQGNLYIGLSGVQAPESVNLLVQLSEKVMESTIPDPTKLVTWSYLASDEWKDFTTGTNINDATTGLIRSGIVTLDIPSDISSGNTLMPANTYWLRAQAKEHLTLFSNIIAISTQVVEVAYSNPGSSQRSSLILDISVITKPITPIPRLKSVSQPFPSTGGIIAEDRVSFYTRISERLRHKKRAITPWDYERLVLQNFPDVYKIKCIANSSRQTTTKASTPGNIDLVVIRRVDASETPENIQAGPVFGFTVLESIKEYLQQYASPHARIVVRNPVYEKLIVKCKVRFYDNNPFFIQRLTKSISDFLSPWVKGNAVAYAIGEGLQKSTILAFIQQLDYVEFVTGFSIIKISEINGKFHFYDSAKTDPEMATSGQQENTVMPLRDTDVLYALTPYSVFISADHHVITAIDDIVYSKPSPLGIDELSTGMDFIIDGGDTVSDAGTEEDTTNLYMI